MDQIDKLVSDALNDFRTVAKLADAEFIADSITVEIIPQPHRPPPRLPTGRVAVYAFFLRGQALKIGKAGPKSAARYTSQHYNPKSSRSNLARSILANQAKVGASGLDELNVGSWIKQRTDRVNLLMPIDLTGHMQSLLESFLHVRWKPQFEGKGDDG